MTYEKPTLVILELEIKDVICTSIDDGTGDNETPSGGSWA